MSRLDGGAESPANDQKKQRASAVWWSGGVVAEYWRGGEVLMRVEARCFLAPVAGPEPASDRSMPEALQRGVVNWRVWWRTGDPIRKLKEHITST